MTAGFQAREVMRSTSMEFETDQVRARMPDLISALTTALLEPSQLDYGLYPSRMIWNKFGSGTNLVRARMHDLFLDPVEDTYIYALTSIHAAR